MGVRFPRYPPKIMKKLLLFLLLIGCSKEEPKVALQLTKEEDIVDVLFEDAINKDPSFFTDEEILQHFLLHDPTFVDPPVTSVGDE